MIVLEQLAHTLADLLRADARRVLLGEDVVDGGMLGLSRIAREDSGLAARLLPTPLAPATFVAHAAGLALAGWRPIALFGSMLPLVEGLAGLREAALIPWRTAGQRKVPLVLVAPCGPGFGLGGEASEGLEAILCRVPRLRVLCAGRPTDADAWLRAAIELRAGEEPTVLLLPRSVLASAIEPATDPDALATPAEPRRLRDGRALTVFAWGDALAPALAAVDRAGVDAAVVDVGCLAPLAADALVDEARATGRIVIAHAGPRSGGIGAELAALFADRAILYLDAPITRVTGSDVPLTATEEVAAAPSISRIADAVVQIAAY